MSEHGITKALFVTDAPGAPAFDGGYDRLYFGHEFCRWRLPEKRRLAAVREAAAAAGMAFTLVTPVLDEEGLADMLELLEGVVPGEEDELVVNDVGLLELARKGAWRGAVAAGRLLTRQRRGAGWKGRLPEEEGAARYLRGSSLDSPGFVERLRGEYGVRRFEIDNLVQGVEVGELPADVRLSVYYPYLFLTATALCPWTFDGRRWRRGEGCPSCEGELLELEPAEGGGRILMGGGIQFLENPSPEVYGGPAVDRWIFQPRPPA